MNQPVQDGAPDQTTALLRRAFDSVGEPAVRSAITLFATGNSWASLAAGLSPLVVQALRGLLEDVASRLLSEIEQRRIAIAAVSAAGVIQERRTRGDVLFERRFFRRPSDGRSEATEILESVLLRARNEAEERKAAYIGRLFGNLAFRDDVTGAEAHQLLRRVDRLTYRQVVMLALVGRQKELDLAFSWAGLLGNNPTQEDRNFMLLAAARELSDLVHGMGNTHNSPFFEPMGQLLYELMDLATLPADEVKDIADEIRHSLAPRTSRTEVR